MKEDEKKEILESYKWIKVKPYKMNAELSWESRYKELEEHHVKETTFLIEKIRSMVDNFIHLDSTTGVWQQINRIAVNPVNMSCRNSNRTSLL